MSILEENWHPLARKFPLIGGGQPGDPEWDAFRADVARTRGNVEPATYRMIRGVKQWLDGRNRLLADEQLGLPFYAKKELLNDKEAFLWIISRNVRRRHLTAEQRRGIVQELRNEGMKIKDIADAVGVDPRTIDRDLHQVDEDSKNTTNVVSALENPSNCSPSEEGPDEPPNVLADPITSEQAAMDAEPTPWEPAPESPPSPAPAAPAPAPAVLAAPELSDLCPCDAAPLAFDVLVPALRHHNPTERHVHRACVGVPLPFVAGKTGRRHA